MIDAVYQKISLRAALRNKEVLTGLLLISFAIFGLWLSRNYPIGTALRMGTGYLPRLLCWILLGLGGLIAVQGVIEVLRGQSAQFGQAISWRPVVFVTTGIIVFGLSLERLGLLIAIALLTAISAFAGRGLKATEALMAGLVLAGMSWAIFVLGLGVAIPVWPEW